MKTTLIILAVSALAFLTSCQADPEEKAIADFVQTIGGTKTDMKFEAIKMETIHEVTASDSINFWLEQLGFNDVQTMIDTMEVRVAERARIIEENKDAGGSNMRAYVTSLKAQQPMMVIVVRDLKEYASVEGTQVIGKQIKCTYSIENPLLNNAKQELTRTFYFDNDSKTVTSQLEAG